MRAKRHIPEIERLEARETPDVSLGSAARLAPLAAPHAAPAPTDLPAATLLDRAGPIWTDELSPRAVESLFANPFDLGPLLGESTLLAPAADKQFELAGWRFQENYTRKAVRNEELRFGPLPDHEDIAHQVFVEWREQAGPGGQAFAGLLHKDSPERLLLRKTVRQVIDRARYQYQRQQRTAELLDQPAPVKAAEQDWQELQLDWEVGGNGPSARERQVLEMRRQGMTFEEIGAELGMVKQRVSEIYQAVVERLQARYAPV